MIRRTPPFPAHPSLRIVLAALAIALAFGPARAVPVPGPTERAKATADEARQLEEMGAWGGAAAKLRVLRTLVPPDADLELWLAIFDARSGALDSARIRLQGPILNAAVSDTLPDHRWIDYNWKKSGTWIDGRWTGWHWNLWRARAEVAAAEGRWSDALGAIRRAIGARPADGKEWYARAVCEAHLGLNADAQTSLDRAQTLDPSLPEIHYLAGLLAWRAGDRAGAQSRFRAAIEIASGFREPTVALLRVRLPGSAPDTLPRTFLSGVRTAGLLTSSDGPKREVFLKADVPAQLISRESVPAAAGATPRKVPVQLLIDREGRVVLSELPYLAGASADQVGPALATLPHWRYAPAIVNNINSPAWVATDLELPR
jgi:tetratricopeptide (TPR) repeat protein